MANVLKNSYNEANHFDRVTHQRGVDVLDFELNEAQDNLRVMAYRTGEDLGDGAGTSTDLLCQGDNTTINLIIKATTKAFMIDGMPIRLEADTTLAIAETMSGPTQVYNVYAQVSEQEVADPAQMLAIGPTTVRQQYVLAFGATTSAIPSDTVSPVWLSGTRYRFLAQVSRPNGQLAIRPTDVTDKRAIQPSIFVTAAYQANGTPLETITGDLTVTGNLTFNESTITNSIILQTLMGWTPVNTGLYLCNGIVTMPGTTGANHYVAYGSKDSTHAGIAYSVDLINWTVVQLHAGSTYSAVSKVAWNGLTGGSMLLVAVGTDDVNPFIYSSADGITWTSRTVPAGITNCNSVAWSATIGGGLWCLVGYGTTKDIATSPDAITWTAAQIGTAAAFVGLDVAVGAGVFVVIGANALLAGDQGAFYSSDGSTWTRIATPTWADLPTHLYGDAVTFANGKFVAITQAGHGFSGGGLHHISTSTDGITWTEITALTNYLDTNSVTYDTAASLWVAVSSTGKLMVSFDNGATWKGYSTLLPASYHSATFAGTLPLKTSVYDSTTGTILVPSSGAHLFVSDAYAAL